jgi:menaquinone-specific isochorismate synthase
MTILPIDPVAQRNPAALRGFLAQCQAAAVRRGHPQLASISLEVDALDPLAVLESIFEPGERHFYVERPAERKAIAGAEAVLAFSAHGPDRFARCQDFVAETLEHTLAVGDLAGPFSGPHFFAAFAFADETQPGEAFPAASIFVPRWQVARDGDRTVAVANLRIDAASSVDALTEKVWRAHGKFAAFDYEAPRFGPRPTPAVTVAEVGPADGYRRAVARALALIESQAFTKIVLARAKDLTASEPFHPLRILNGLRQRFADCYAFSLANGRGQSFIGASPERLLQIEGGRLQTGALAGSTGRGGSASEDGAIAAALLRGEKEAREHRVVLDFIVERLAALGLQPEYSARPEVRRYANVQHLHTAVKAAVPAGLRVLDVAARLQPTPAVGGAPAAAAVPQIRPLEGFPRGLYAGALGWLDSRGGGELFVGIRAGLIDGVRARLYAGNGIVRGSSPEGEWAETELKFRAMQEALLS